MEMNKTVEAFQAKTRLQWRRWLQKHSQSKTEICLVIAHKNSKVPGIKYAEAVEEALCFGWIDSLTNRRDEHSFYQRFSPRKPASNWSQSNRDRVARLDEAGLMTAEGWRVIEVSKQKGRWEPVTT